MTTDRSGMITFRSEVADVQAYLARPQTDEPRPAVIVIHDIMGLSDHTKDIANRFAQQGYVALAPHLYSRPQLVDVMTPPNIGMTLQFLMSLPPDRQSDREFVREEVAKLPEDQRAIVHNTLPMMIGRMPKDELTQDLIKGIDYLKAQPFVRADKIGSVGFCFGGGMSLNLVCHAPLAACVVFYGENPTPIEKIKNIAGPVLGLYGAEDSRINPHLDELVKAIVEYKKDFEMRIYPNAAHAFFNDTNPRAYREAAARAAWQQVLAFYRRTLWEE